MKLTISTKEDLIGLMDNWDPSECDALTYAKSLFPNSYKAMDLAMEEAKSEYLPGDENSFFTITMFVHHTKSAPPILKEERVRKVKLGFTGAVHIFKDDMQDGQVERSVADIQSTISKQLHEQISKLLSRTDIH